MKTPRLLPFVTAATVAAALAATAFAAFPGLDKLNDITRRAEDVNRNAKNVAKVAKGVSGISLPEELAIGDAVAIRILERFGGLWRDAAATRRVNLLGRALARYAQRQDFEWQFGVLNSDEVNAFSAPGGRVFITRGLYKLLPTDDELAGALGHEIAHIDRRHALKIISRGEALGGITALVQEHGRGDFRQYDDVVLKLTEEIFTKGYDPNTEFDADTQGRRLAVVTGYAPGGLRAVIERLQAAGAAGDEDVFSTHPPAEARLKKLPKDPAPVAAPAEPAKPAKQ